VQCDRHDTLLGGGSALQARQSAVRQDAVRQDAVRQGAHSYNRLVAENWSSRENPSSRETWGVSRDLRVSGDI
jgi:hypothetical protein